tara:strand:- start:8829 stop:9023 length:195 start_codon:yes stop_codon:yes gene_type:complete
MKRVLRLGRKDERYLLGVCSGIARYFEINTLIVRLLFFALIFFTGASVPLYIILYISLPNYSND